MLKSNRFLFGRKVPTHICRARLPGRFAQIQNWGDRFAGITIFAPIKANIGGPDEAPRNFPSWSTLLLKIYCRVADVNQEIRVQLVYLELCG